MVSTNRAAFHSLLAKFLDAWRRPGLRRVSLPGALPVVRAKRRASAPYSLIASTGSSTLPLVLLILAPCSSRTRPWRYTVPKGASPMFSMPIITMRATQKKRMSYPVSMTVVG